MNTGLEIIRDVYEFPQGRKADERIWASYAIFSLGAGLLRSLRSVEVTTTGIRSGVSFTADHHLDVMGKRVARAGLGQIVHSGSK